MIKEKIYNYETAYDKTGVSFYEFLSNFVDKVDTSLVPENVKFDDLEEICFKILGYQDKIVTIIGDYDVDGVTASSILYKGLNKLGFNVKVIIPDRFDDGYGMSVKLVKKASSYGANLIITVDNGINAIEAVKEAKKLGIDTIITDHHLPNDDLYKSEKYVLNPHTTLNNLKHKGVCGAYVALILAINLLKVKGIIDEKLTEELKELASVGTIADVMELKSENQTLLYNSMKNWKNGKILNKGLRFLISSLGKFKPEELEQENIGFYLGPCLNANGRLESAYSSFEILTDDNNTKICKNVLKTVNNNLRRQNIVNDVIKNITYKTSGVNVIKINSKDYKEYSVRELEGVAGLISSKVVEMASTPVLTFVNEKFSARSVADIDLHKLISLAKTDNLGFGGHKEACGGKFIDGDLRFDELERNLELHLKEAELNVEIPLIRIPLFLSPKEMKITLDVLKPYSNLPAFIIENVEGRNPEIFSEKHTSFYIDTNIGKVKALKFNQILELPDTFKIKKMKLKPAIDIYNNGCYIVESIFFK